MKVLILWSGAVVPAYRQFFLELATHMRVRVLSPRRWTHGSRAFEADPAPALPAGSGASRSAGDAGCEIIPVAYVPERSSRYWVPSLAFHLWAFRPRYVYIMDEMDRPSLAWHALCARLAWPPVKVISYALQNLERPGYHRWHHRLATWMNGKLVSRSIAASREADEVLKANGYAKPTRVIPLWGSEAFFFPGERESIRGFRRGLGLEEGETVILYAGSLVEAKGLLLLKDALPRFPRLRVLSAGNGPLESSLAGVPGGRWIHLGALEGEGLRRFYQAGDYIILPSLTLPDWKEQIGRSLIEGILCGCTALGSDSGHIPELTLFPETTFRQGDAESLGRMLAGLPLPHARSVREAQDRNVRERFTARAVARETWSFLREADP
ncbi:MAG TPA: glycosyltransferase family 4 protein [Fibrobacteria bacterium]|nr:glycosyltransferase family 4 protein [Fibrobacteria bacterium]